MGDNIIYYTRHSYGYVTIEYESEEKLYAVKVEHNDGSNHISYGDFYAGETSVNMLGPTGGEFTLPLTKEQLDAVANQEVLNRG